MIIIAAVTIIIQAFFLAHVFRTGRSSRWAFIIFAFPVVGCLAYYFVEVFPNSREHRKARRLGRDMVRSMNPDAEMNRRIVEMEICGSVDNKKALAEECLERGMSHEAIRLYRSCLAGIYVNDPTLLFGLATACVENGAHEEALNQIQQLTEQHPSHKANEVRLLKARALETMGNISSAITEYAALIPVYNGLEARYRYGCLLKSAGDAKQAQEIFNDLLAHAKRFRIATEVEQDWILKARQALDK